MVEKVGCLRYMCDGAGIRNLRRQVLIWVSCSHKRKSLKLRRQTCQMMLQKQLDASLVVFMSSLLQKDPPRVLWLHPGFLRLVRDLLAFFPGFSDLTAKKRSSKGALIISWVSDVSESCPDII